MEGQGKDSKGGNHKIDQDQLGVVVEIPRKSAQLDHDH